MNDLVISKFPLAADRVDSLRNNTWLLDHDKNSHVGHSEKKNKQTKDNS